MEDIKIKILKLIKGLQSGDGVLYLELMGNLKGIISWKELRYLLIELEEEGLIEERHFDDGKVDYKIEPKGWNFLKSIQKSAKLN